MNKLHAAAIALAVVGGAAIGIAAAGPSNAAPQGVDAYAYESEVDLADIPNIDSLPTCLMEDGSDVLSDTVPVCIWGNQGNAWLTYSDRSYLIVDHTDGNVSDMELGA